MRMSPRRCAPDFLDADRLAQAGPGRVCRILEHIETESKSGAARIRGQVLYSIGFLSEWPLIGREGRRGYRELVVPHTPYVVLYRCYEDEVHIVRVLHGSRRR